MELVKLEDTEESLLKAEEKLKALKYNVKREGMLY